MCVCACARVYMQIKIAMSAGTARKPFSCTLQECDQGVIDDITVIVIRTLGHQGCMPFKGCLQVKYLPVSQDEC